MECETCAVVRTQFQGNISLFYFFKSSVSSYANPSAALERHVSMIFCSMHVLACLQHILLWSSATKEFFY